MIKIKENIDTYRLRYMKSNTIKYLYDISKNTLLHYLKTLVLEPVLITTDDNELIGYWTGTEFMNKEKTIEYFMKYDSNIYAYMKHVRMPKINEHDIKEQSHE